MIIWRQWVERPQTLGFRKALFQVHLWLGIGVGLYILLISVSGSVVVYRREIMAKYYRPPPIIAASGPRISADDLKQDVLRLYPGYVIDNFLPSRRPDRCTTIVLRRGRGTITRLLNPYTGEDLGDPESRIEHSMYWVVDLHDNLLGDTTGRAVNGMGSIFTLILALSGVVIWWPGAKTWRRSIGAQWERSFVRFNWDLHSVVGFWFSLFILMWGITGIYLCFPQPFAVFSDQAQAWLARLHFGRMNLYTKTIWPIFGLAPALLFFTGVVMWWSRVINPFLKRRYVRARSASQAVAQE